MGIEGVAIIPRCAECEAHWLPADEDRWQAWLTDDDPPELTIRRSSRSTAVSAPSGSSARRHERQATSRGVRSLRAARLESRDLSALPHILKR